MPFPLPGAPTPAGTDYIAYEAQRRRVWIPVANGGHVDVFDVASRTFARIDGFKTALRTRDGKPRTVGPSAVAIGDGYAYVGDRATGEVCAVSESTLAVGACSTLKSPTDGVAYVAASKEVWVTTPGDKAIVVLDATHPAVLAPKASLRFDGEPEGYATDTLRGRFYTNLEDANRTVAVDIATHRILATWGSGCESDGPRGIAVDSARGFVFVACTDRVVVFDSAPVATAAPATPVARFFAGAGVDNIDWLDGKRLLYVAAGSGGTLTVLGVDDAGRPSVAWQGSTGPGTRNAVAGEDGAAYAVDRNQSRLLVFAPPR